MNNLTNIAIRIIHLLSSGKFYSLIEISQALNVNVNYINDYINLIRNWGLEVFVIPKIGCCLHQPLCLLDCSKINSYLLDNRLTVLTIVNSTNQYLMDRINCIQSGDVCVAEYQTNGRGKYGRTWISSFGNNICLSIYWKFTYYSQIRTISLLVAIITAELLQDLGIVGVRVKWPNDLYLQDKKFAGILVEVINDINGIIHIIIGLGINLSMSILDNFTSKINQDWINLECSGIYINRNVLIAQLINKLRQSLKQFETNKFKLFTTRWRKLDIFFNKPVRLLINNKEISGIALGTNIYGGLILNQKDKLKCYFNGELSLLKDF